MNQTTNYQLSQWDAGDRILREDFNANNAKLEQALAAQAEAQNALQAALANCGNCSISISSYTGTGTSGSSNPTKISFSRKPTAFMIRGNSVLAICTNLDTTNTFVMAYNGNTMIFPITTLSWSGNQARLVNTSDPRYQANDSDVVYQVIAFYQET